MKRVLLWLLPFVDVFTIGKILKYYGSLGVNVPLNHAKLGLLERWIGYLPIGFIICWLLGPLASVLAAITVLALVGPIELYLMFLGTKPWKFFKGTPRRIVTKIFLLEGYNVLAYYMLGALLAWLIQILKI